MWAKSTFFYGILACFGAIAANLGGCGYIPNSADTQERWNAANNPALVNSTFETKLSILPAAGSLTRQPWADDYWPSVKRGIANRWVIEDTPAGENGFMGLAELKQAPSYVIDALSPAEKWDILNGDYDYSVTKFELSRTSGQHESWEGLCHGWAPAAYLYPQPRPVTVTSADGITIRFGSSDIKALLTWYEAEVSTRAESFLGERCNINLEINPSAASSAPCRDTNAGSFHIVLANQIGRFKKGFVVDITRDLEVWNQPVSAFKSRFLQIRLPSLGSAPGTVKEIVVETEMFFGVEVNPHWNPIKPQLGFGIGQQVYRYVLELNGSGNIIGGSWLSNERPDFIWTKSRKAFIPEFAKLQQLLPVE